VTVFKNREMEESKVEIVHFEAWGCVEFAVEWASNRCYLIQGVQVQNRMTLQSLSAAEVTVNKTCERDVRKALRVCSSCNSWRCRKG
jgi:hypothetical protein